MLQTHYPLKSTFTILLLMVLILDASAQKIDRMQFKLREQTIDFMHDIASDFEQLEELKAKPNDTATDFDKLSRLSVLQKINAYLSVNHEAYLLVRTRAFEQLSPPLVSTPL